METEGQRNERIQTKTRCRRSQLLCQPRRCQMIIARLPINLILKMWLCSSCTISAIDNNPLTYRTEIAIKHTMPQCGNTTFSCCFFVCPSRFPFTFMVKLCFLAKVVVRKRERTMGKRGQLRFCSRTPLLLLHLSRDKYV